MNAIEKVNISQFVGIPYKLGSNTFNACGCFGIVHLYFKHVHNFFVPPNDGRKIWSFRNKKKDPDRIMNAYKDVTKEVIIDKNDLKINDIVILKGMQDDYGVGVIVDREHFLTSRRKAGSHIGTTSKFKRYIVKGLRVL